MLSLFLTVCLSAQMQDCRVYRLSELPAEALAQPSATTSRIRPEPLAADSLLHWSRHNRAKPGHVAPTTPATLQSRFRN